MITTQVLTQYQIYPHPLALFPKQREGEPNLGFGSSPLLEEELG